jgi:hypothetical protein
MRASFFEAAGKAVKIGLSLKLNDFNQVQLDQIHECTVDGLLALYALNFSYF